MKENFFIREAAAWPVAELAGPAALEKLRVAYQRGLDQDTITTDLRLPHRPH